MQNDKKMMQIDYEQIKNNHRDSKQLQKPAKRLNTLYSVNKTKKRCKTTK